MDKGASSKLDRATAASQSSPAVSSIAGIPSAARRCGNCELWGRNFYPRYPGWPTNTTCAADAIMDLPASFIPKRQTMTAADGEGCICWHPAQGMLLREDSRSEAEAEGQQPGPKDAP